MGIDNQETEWVSANIITEGVKKIKAADYFGRVKKFKIQRFNGDYQQRIDAVKRALKKLREPYDLIKFNCEHYAEYVQTGKTFSSQVENVFKVVAAVGISLIIIAIINNISND